MKHIVTKSFALTGFSLLPILLTGCLMDLSADNPDFKIYEDGYFKYIFLGDNSKRQDKNDRSLVIVGFTELGLEQETIDVPREIKGHQVKRIGLEDEGYPGGDKSREVVCGDKLRRLFIHNNIETIECFTGRQVDVMVCSSVSRHNRGSLVYYKTTYFYKSLFTELGYDDPNNQSAVDLADVAFLYNYVTDSNETIHRIDNLNNDDKINLPPEPVRDRYSFTGWYTEPECTNVWDFNDTPSIEKGSQLNLYAGWKIV